MKYRTWYDKKRPCVVYVDNTLYLNLPFVYNSVARNNKNNRSMAIQDYSSSEKIK